MNYVGIIVGAAVFLCIGICHPAVIKILLIGEDYYGRLEGIPWWYFLLSAVVFAGFWFMFTGVVRKYAARIMAMPEPRTSVFKTFSVKGYLIIAFMITLGIVLKNIPQVPDSFIAWFGASLKRILQWHWKRGMYV